MLLPTTVSSLCPEILVVLSKIPFSLLVVSPSANESVAFIG